MSKHKIHEYIMNCQQLRTYQTSSFAVTLTWEPKPECLEKRRCLREQTHLKGRVELHFGTTLLYIAEMQMFYLYKSLGFCQIWSDSCRIAWRGPDLFVRWRWVRSGPARPKIWDLTRMMVICWCGRWSAPFGDGLICSTPNLVQLLKKTWWKHVKTTIKTCKTVT